MADADPRTTPIRADLIRDVLSRAMPGSVGLHQALEALKALDQLQAEFARLVVERDAAIHAREVAEHHADELGTRVIRAAGPFNVPVPRITEHGPARAVRVTWPDDRPDWTPVTPEALESMAATITAYRCAEHARAATAWWAPWRWLRG